MGRTRLEARFADVCPAGAAPFGNGRLGVNTVFRPATTYTPADMSGLPAGVSVEPGRIEVRFNGAKDAVGRLFALAQALTNDYERFEALVEGENPASGGGEVRE